MKQCVVWEREPAGLQLPQIRIASVSIPSIGERTAKQPINIHHIANILEELELQTYYQEREAVVLIVDSIQVIRTARKNKEKVKPLGHHIDQSTISLYLPHPPITRECAILHDWAMCPRRSAL